MHVWRVGFRVETIGHWSDQMAGVRGERSAERGADDSPHTSLQRRLSLLDVLFIFLSLESRQ